MYTQQHHYTTALFPSSHQAVWSLILNPWFMCGHFCSCESDVWIDFFTRLFNRGQPPSSCQWQHDARSSSFVCRLFSLLLILYFLLSLFFFFFYTNVYWSENFSQTFPSSKKYTDELNPVTSCTFSPISFISQKFSLFMTLFRAITKRETDDSEKNF